MNILVVNENFTGGGLETHIHSYYMELREKHHFVFAFGRYESKLKLDSKDVYPGFHFDWSCSIQDFIDDVEHLVRLIHKEKIDVIHAHPYHSIIPAVMAGQLTGVPVVSTHHIYGCFTFPCFSVAVNETLLLYYAYAELVSCVFSVSSTQKLALEKRAHVANVVFMPNAVDSRLYRQHTVANNRLWAFISRLDTDVFRTAIQFFDMLPQLPIDGIDIYGDGTRRKELEEYVVLHGLKERVRFMGFCTDLYDRLDGHYNGVIGQSRVALEGLTMGYPVLEMGDGRICGLLYGDLLQKAKDNNFMANTLPELDGRHIAAQLEQAYVHLEQFDFREEMIKTFNIQIIAEAYVKQLAALDPAPHANMVTWFEAMKVLPDPEASFYGSQDVFQTIKENIGLYAIDRNMMDLILLGNNCANLENGIGLLQMRIQEMQGQFRAQIAGLEEAQRLLWEQLQVQAQLLRQMQEQTEYHRKILAPLIQVRKLLSKIKRKIKRWLS